MWSVHGIQIGSKACVMCAEVCCGDLCVKCFDRVVVKREFCDLITCVQNSEEMD